MKAAEDDRLSKPRGHRERERTKREREGENEKERDEPRPVTTATRLQGHSFFNWCSQGGGETNLAPRTHDNQRVWKIGSPRKKTRSKKSAFTKSPLVQS